jgi:hypothetical protein
MNDDDEEEEYEVYEFVTTGEKTCERCMALAGSQWREPPDPPHAHCECEVVVKMAGRHAPRDCGDTTWSMEAIPGGESTVRYGPGGLDGFEWGFNVTIDCWDGGVHEFEIWVDMGSEDDYGGVFSETIFADLNAFAWSEVYDEAEAVAARVCQQCSPPLLS